ncbi:mitochondrial coenzyme A diphosphatase NUDT8 [Hetaerina americana]|uniref:mitochondrial coenzyme A diphosphatase NUDT8 n=1 Tax=Hetaerina americana TaxID=62018 RepID=UPI003A7F3ED3
MLCIFYGRLTATGLLRTSNVGVKVLSTEMHRQVPGEISVETVIDESNKKRCITRFRRMPSIRIKPGEIPRKQAAVLVPLCIVDNRISLLYTLRSSSMTKNAGQVSFPGGMMDPTDQDLIHTALRETQEELGIDKENIDVWCTGNFIGTWDKKMGVMPVLGYIGEVDVTKLKKNPDEVEEAFAVSLQDLCEPQNARYTKFIRGYCMPVYIARGHKIWGLTAIITHLVLSALLQERYTSDPGLLFRLFTKVKL